MLNCARIDDVIATGTNFFAFVTVLSLNDCNVECADNLLHVRRLQRVAAAGPLEIYDGHCNDLLRSSKSIIFRTSTTLRSYLTVVCLAVV